MNATRFINLSPLSLLANLVGLHFKGFHFPLKSTGFANFYTRCSHPSSTATDIPASNGATFD
jgi:hypothetical protein